MPGATGAGKAFSATSDVSGVTIGSAGFSRGGDGGNVQVNGAEVTVATTDTLEDVFDKIATATGDTVTTSYLPASDKIRLSSSARSPSGARRTPAIFWR